VGKRGTKDGVDSLEDEKHLHLFELNKVAVTDRRRPRSIQMTRDASSWSVSHHRYVGEGKKQGKDGKDADHTVIVARLFGKATKKKKTAE